MSRDVRFYNEIGKLEFRYIPLSLWKSPILRTVPKNAEIVKKKKKLKFGKPPITTRASLKKDTPLWQLITMFSTYIETIILFSQK